MCSALQQQLVEKEGQIQKLRDTMSTKVEKKVSLLMKARCITFPFAATVITCPIRRLSEKNSTGEKTRNSLQKRATATSVIAALPTFHTNCQGVTCALLTARKLET